MFGGVGGLAVIAALAFCVGGWLYAHRDAPKATTALFLVGGIGVGGVIGGWLAGGLAWLLSLASTTGARLIGLSTLGAIAGIAVVACLEVFVKGIGVPRRRNAHPRRWHPWLAAALPTVVIASGVPVLAALFGGLAGAAGEAGATVARLMSGG